MALRAASSPMGIPVKNAAKWQFWMNKCLSYRLSSMLNSSTWAKRRLLKTRINHRHEPFIHRLPLEIPSNIFIN
ncbi:hypothetical protein M413DRAFT_291618 [Hebeloma cylindrosporum]|uniref:Uncharacterized protein n=1 Tax=Hebeloma cylindrosporum TaxID=76867 RepID=A0A0C3BY08_HEBCY|nr:hypothetical protein M413DRAFT_291618 [Hebeloma cylindrosporum h7]